MGSLKARAHRLFSGVILACAACGPASEETGASDQAVNARAPFVAPEKEWAWFDVEGTSCANGKTTGLGVNLTSDSDDLVIFLEGGGACWDGLSCWGPTPLATYMATGYGKVQFETDGQRNIYLLDRTNVDNPFRDKNLVFIPYCTGDAFAGNTVKKLTYLTSKHETHFVGHRNIETYLERLTATFPRAKRVWIAGDSAGGFGVALNFPFFQNAFHSARVDVLDDSGPPIDPPESTWKRWRNAWDMQFPPGCPNCESGPSAYLDYYRATYPNNRFGLISFRYDLVISPFMVIKPTTFNQKLYALADQIDEIWDTARYFILPGSGHIGFYNAKPELKAWINAMVNDDPNWTSVRP